ncbi:hypothetical protein K7X08_004181 [Anisodus acutangulus]|uniref:Uncharacterized protein n=1 Tax=Anisodus acutangulus TaxID=402998 RepID=A0A9Q1MH36_9SOLA|nr:hypothetical protein K7X08_004181 [Anisodus acutangulus]
MSFRSTSIEKCSLTLGFAEFGNNNNDNKTVSFLIKFTYSLLESQHSLSLFLVEDPALSCRLGVYCAVCV